MERIFRKSQKSIKRRKEYKMIKHRHTINEIDALRVELDILHNEHLSLAVKFKELEKKLK